MSPAFKLTYYNSQGLGECIRYLFVLKGIEFDDVRLTENDDFGIFLKPEFHKSPPYHRIPQLEFEGKKLTQTTTILRFLGRKFDLCGKDEFEFSKCDQYIESTRDFLQYFTPAFLEKDKKKRKELFDSCNVTTNCYMSIINDFLEANGGNHLVGNTWSIADIYFIHIVTVLGELFNKSQPIYGEFPLLGKLRKFLCSSGYC